MIMKSKNEILKKFHRDAGFTFIEATISVVLISLIFLSFTVSMLAFREWMDRSWAVRTMDQYAHDVMDYLHNLMQVSKEVGSSPVQQQLNNFEFKILDLDPYTKTTRDTIRYFFSGNKSELVKVKLGEAAAKEFYNFRTGGREVFPPRGWDDNYKVELLQFKFWDAGGADYYREREDDQLLSDMYDKAMVRVEIQLQLLRDRDVWEPGEVGQPFFMTKKYQMSFFMKNVIEQSD
jgi:hypothetical protein